jgi:hypothetical protein
MRFVGLRPELLRKTPSPDQGFPDFLSLSKRIPLLSSGLRLQIHRLCTRSQFKNHDDHSDEVIGWPFCLMESARAPLTIARSARILLCSDSSPRGAPDDFAGQVKGCYTGSEIGGKSFSPNSLMILGDA